MDKKKLVATVAAVSAFLVSVVPLVADLINSLISNWKGVIR